MAIFYSVFTVVSWRRRAFMLVAGCLACDPVLSNATTLADVIDNSWHQPSNINFLTMIFDSARKVSVTYKDGDEVLPDWKRQIDWQSSVSCQTSQEVGIIFHAHFDPRRECGPEIHKIALEDAAAEAQAAKIENRTLLLPSLPKRGPVVDVSYNAGRPSHNRGDDDAEEGAKDQRVEKRPDGVNRFDNLLHTGIALLGGGMIGFGVSSLQMASTRLHRVIGMFAALAGALAVALGIGALLGR